MSTLYKDGLVEMTDQEVVFRRYYFPFGGDKHLALSQIERVEVREPSFTFGSWRIWGGGPRTWFPFDGNRPSRDAIFVAYVRGCFGRVGFTVERSKEVIQLLKERGLLGQSPSA
jgi:hypothetical protein